MGPLGVAEQEVALARLQERGGPLDRQGVGLVGACGKAWGVFAVLIVLALVIVASRRDRTIQATWCATLDAT